MLSLPVPAAVQLALLALHSARPSLPPKLASLLKSLMKTAVEGPVHPERIRSRSIVDSLMVSVKLSPLSIVPVVPTFAVANAVGLGAVLSMVTVQLVVAGLPSTSVAVIWNVLDPLEMLASAVCAAER